MSFELIRRKEGEMSQKQEIRHQHTQFSLNSYGHLCIREFDDKQPGYRCKLGGGWACDNEEAIKARACIACSCQHYRPVEMSSEEDILVLDHITTRSLINFIFENRSTHEFREFIKQLINRNNELPF
jgi:hypothetical protein